jgi:hypothetical protein
MNRPHLSPPTTGYASLPAELRQAIADLAFPTLREQRRGMLISRDFYLRIGQQRPFSDMARCTRGAPPSDNIQAMSLYVARLSPPARQALRAALSDQPARFLAPVDGLLALHESALVRHNPAYWLALPRERRGDAALAELALRGNPSLYRLLPAPLRAHAALACLALAPSPSALQWLPDSLIDHRDVLLACVPHVLAQPVGSTRLAVGVEVNQVLRATRERLERDLAFACEAARKHDRVLPRLLPLGPLSADLVVAHLQAPGRLLPARPERQAYPAHLFELALHCHAGNLFRFDPSTWANAARLVAAIDSGVRPPRGEPALLEQLAAQPTLAVSLVQRWPDAFFDLPHALRDHQGVARALLEGGGRLPPDSPAWPGLQDDVLLARRVAQRAPAMLTLFSDACLGDREVIKGQIRHAAAFPSPGLRALYRDDAELLLLAAARAPSELEVASSRLLADASFLLRALGPERPVEWLGRAHLALLDSETFMLQAIARNWRAYAMASPRLLASEGFRQRAVAQDENVSSLPMARAPAAEPELAPIHTQAAFESLLFSHFAFGFDFDDVLALAGLRRRSARRPAAAVAAQTHRARDTARLVRDGHAFRHLDDEARDDASRLLRAVTSVNENHFFFASTRLQNDDEVLAACFARSAASLAHAARHGPERLSPALIERYLATYPQALWHLSNEQFERPEWRRCAALALSETAAVGVSVITPQAVSAALLSRASESLPP